MSGRYETRASPGRRATSPNKKNRSSASPAKKPINRKGRRVTVQYNEALFCATPLTNSPAGDSSRFGTDWEPEESQGVHVAPSVHHGSLRALTAAKSTTEDAGVMADPVAVVILSVIACMMCAVLLKELEGSWPVATAGAAFGRKLSATKPTEPTTILNGGIEQAVSLARGYVSACLKYLFGVAV